jgi:hypothetical protein
VQAIRRFAFRLIYPESRVAIASISISANSATVAFSKGIHALAKCRSKQLFWELEEFPVAASPSQREEAVDDT